MRTYFLRYERQCANALAVSRFLAGHPHVKRVFYPGLESHPQHALATQQMKDFGTVVSIELDGAAREGDRFAEALEFFSIAASLGSTSRWSCPGTAGRSGIHPRATGRVADRPGHRAAVHRG